MSAPKKITGKVMDLLGNIDPGDSFLTESTPSQVTAYAVKLKVKCKTKKVLLMEDYTTANPRLKTITKVTRVS